MSMASTINFSALKIGAEPRVRSRNATRACRPVMAIQSNSASRGEGQQTALAGRRGLLEGVVGAAALSVLPPTFFTVAPAFADEAVADIVAPIVKSPVIQFNEPVLAYQFGYPQADNTGKDLKWFTSRTPERYSSAAPMSADARQRIVYEVVDFSEPIIISVSVGPVPPGLVKKSQADWKPEEVANAILTDKSTARVTNGQKVALSVIENANLVEKDGTAYWQYEHVSQGSPNMNEVLQKETYRHSYAVTGLRGDYMYTLNMACPERRWETVQASFKEAMESFTLVTPTKEFAPPESQPWRFW